MKVLAVLSGKGGVGKTTTVSNLSAALTTEFGRSVVGIDGNVTTPNLGLHLGIFSFPHTLNDVLEGVIPLREAIYTCSNGVRLIPAQLSFDSGDVDLTGMRNSLSELDADLVLIDSCPGLGNEIVPTLKITDEALIVTNPEIPAITDALRAIELAGRYNVPVRGVILNRVRKDKYELSVTEVESVFDVPVISVIPEDSGVREGIFLGDPVVMNKPFSSAAIEFRKLAGYLVDEKYRVSFIDRIKWLFARIFKKSKSRWKSPEAPVTIESLVETPNVTEKPPEDPLKKPEPPEEPPKKPPQKPLKKPEPPKEPPKEPPQEPSKEPLKKPPEEPPKKPPQKRQKPSKKRQEPPKKPEPPESDHIESKLAFLKIKKDVIEASLDRLEKKFQEGQVDKDLYIRLKDKYIYELDSYRTEISKSESGINK